MTLLCSKSFKSSPFKIKFKPPILVFKVTQLILLSFSHCTFENVLQQVYEVRGQPAGAISPMWVLEIDLRSSGLTASVLTAEPPHWPFVLFFSSLLCCISYPLFSAMLVLQAAFPDCFLAHSELPFKIALLDRPLPWPF